MYKFVYIAILCLDIMRAYGNDVNKGLRIAVGSCNNHKREGIWDIVSHHKPQKMILLGDNMYADKRTGFTTGFGMFEEANHTELGLEYALLGSDESFQDMLMDMGGLSNVYAVYDDHDYGINNGAANYQYKQESRDEFNKFFQVDYSDSHRETLEDGVYSSHIIEETIDGVDLRIKVIMLDVRYNRVMEPSESCDLLGDKQWKWLQEELDRSIYIYNPNMVNTSDKDAACDLDEERSGVCVDTVQASELAPVDLILLGSGTQILPQGKMIEETWDKDCVPNRERLLGMLSSTIEKSMKYNYHSHSNSPNPNPNPTPTPSENHNHINILLLSGDVHGAEISQARCHINEVLPAYPLVEYTSSGFTHSFTHHTPMKNFSKSNNMDTDIPYESHKQRVRSLSTPVASKGRFGEWIYDLYQMVTPTHHRVDKTSDHYAKPHFAMLYIKPTSTTNLSPDANTDSGPYHYYQQVNVDFHVVNASNDVVMTHRIDYHSQAHSDAGSAVLGRSHIQKCSLVRGDVPLYKIIWTRFATAMWIMVCFLLPLLTIIWLVCASIYYICIGSELKRRHNILVKNRKKMMKKD